MRRHVPTRDEREALPVDGLVVREVRDADSLRRFFHEWHASAHRRSDQDVPGEPRASRRDGMMRA
jgi:hypothetical protein